MRFKFTAFLLALNIISFALIWLLNQKTDFNDFQAGGLSGIISRKIIEADRIEITGKGLETPRILEYDGASWTDNC